MDFRIHEVNTKLFGVVEAKKREPFWSSFANATTTTVSIGPSELSALGLDLGVHLDKVAEDIESFVLGEYRPSEEAPGGTRLGDFGEALAYLLLKAAKEDVVRIVGVDRGPTQKIKGQKFAQPDFLVRRGGSSGCVEVKATDALNYLYLSAPAKWRLLKPCDAVDVCRSRALPQLGWPEPSKARVAYTHNVKLPGKTTVPFPADFGMALGVLAHDGRVAALETDKRFRTPPACRKKTRDCWRCVKTGADRAHLTAVWMPNAPGKLELLGEGDRGADWFRAYERWRQAVWTREVDAATLASRDLATLTSEWIDAQAQRAPGDDLKAGWDRYIHAALGDRGLWEAGVEVEFEGISSDDRLTKAEVVPARDDPPVEIVDHDARIRFDAPVTSRRISFRRSTPEGDGDSFSVFLSEREWHLRLASAEWWKGGKIATEEAARKIARRLLTLAYRVYGPRPGPSEVELEAGEPPLRPLVAKVGNGEVVLGWTLAGSSRWWWRWAGWLFLWPEVGYWPEVFVFTDGRALVRASLRR